MVSTVEVVPDCRSAIDFGLTDRALRFAQNYAACPSWGVTLCAKRAGYSDRGRAAHVRGCELLRDPRVIRAIVHFSGLELAKAMATTTTQLGRLPQRDRFFAWMDQWTVEKLTADVAEIIRRVDRLDKLMTARD